MRRQSTIEHNNDHRFACILLFASRVDHIWHVRAMERRNESFCDGKRNRMEHGLLDMLLESKIASGIPYRNLEMMSDQQSQAHSTHQLSLDNWFRKALRLNRDQNVSLSAVVDGVPRSYGKWSSVTIARC